MIDPERYRANLEIAARLKDEPAFPEGCIVECGVWRGGMIAGFRSMFGEGRHYQLFDSFQGLPPPSAHDGADAHWWAEHPEHPRYFNNCSAGAEYVRKLFDGDSAAGRAEIVEGWFKDTLAAAPKRPVALLHLDCDWYESTLLCLRHFWPLVRAGGAILIDDYYDWEGCRRAVHDFLSAENAREAIERVGKAGGVMVRRLDHWSLAESPHLCVA